MAENTSIEWCDHTFNHVSGCTKVSAGCANCYAAVNYSVKMRGVKWGPQGNRIVASELMWKQPIKWDREAKALGVRKRVFCASLADVFEGWDGPMLNAKGEVLFVSPRGNWFAGGDESLYAEGHPIGKRPSEVTMQDVRDRLFRLIDSTPNLDWLVLTKRPENIAAMMPCKYGDEQCSDRNCQFRFRKNLWLGTSCENQQTADERIPHLLKVPAAVRFLSCEPLLSQVILHRHFAQCECGHGHGFTACPNTGGVAQTCHKCDCKRLRPKISWVIAGGESGPGARPMHPAWAQSLRDQCQAAGVPFFFKQWGHWVDLNQSEPCKTARDNGHNPGFCPIGLDGRPAEGSSADRQRGEVTVYQFGKKMSGRLLDGREWSEFPMSH